MEQPYVKRFRDDMRKLEAAMVAVGAALARRLRCWRYGHSIDYGDRRPVVSVISGETVALSVRCMVCYDEFYITNRISVEPRETDLTAGYQPF